ncbi:MAG: hypothetical protein VKP57_13115 [Candidatus Sericytochromatia bacterium]|nr:hypothetical protein [Candidatus Sericytochromatia bacterium]
MRKFVGRLGLGSLGLVLAACAVPQPVRTTGSPEGGDLAQLSLLPDFEVAPREGIKGRVIWPEADRRLMASQDEVAKRARVGLLQPSAAGQFRTVYTALTDEAGNFNFPAEVTEGANGIPINPEVVLILQAENGLSNNAAGASSARLRTFLTRVASGATGYRSTYEDPQGTGIVFIDLNTTAMAVIKSLRDQSRSPAGDIKAFIGSLTPRTAGSNPTVAPGKVAAVQVPDAEFQTVSALVSNVLQGNRDPLAAIELRDAESNPRRYLIKSESQPVIQDVRYIGTGLPRTVFQPLDPIRVSGVNLAYYNQGVLEFQGAAGVLTAPITGADLNQNTYLDTQVPLDVVKGIAQLRYVAQNGVLAYATMSVVTPLGGSLTPGR